MGVGIVIGLVVALIRLSKLRGVYHLATLYIDFFRSTPVLVQLIWIYYCLPIITGRSFSAFASGAIALSLYAGSFLAEIFRAGILSISKGQTEAALALGMTTSQTLRRIIVPQAVTRMLPPVGSMFISLFKESSLASSIAVAELMWQAQALIAFLFRPMEIFTLTALLYFILTFPQSLWVNYLHRRFLAEG
jgi:His/Glu/Gln/Arg/opine family amino acid ABC transporter permease subunit